MGIQRKGIEYGYWWDTTHMEICDIFSSPDEKQHIYKRIQGLISSRHSGRKTSFDFFRRISNIFQRRYNTKQLPQDLVPDIVSRLPAEDVLKCIMVSKGWMDVILTRNFFDLHEPRAPPLILLENYDETNDTKLYSLDLTHERPQVRRLDTTKLLADCKYYLAGTIDGLLVLHTCGPLSSPLSNRLSICNPLTGRVITGVTFDGDCCFGVWFHPFKREYLFLSTSFSSFKTGRGFRYKIFNLKGESRVLGWYEAFPTREVPIKISYSFYYLREDRFSSFENAIMIFNTETEKVDFKPYPRSLRYYNGHGKNVRMLEIEGSLAFAHVCSDFLYLRKLVDPATWHWIERYKINLNWCRELHLELRPFSIQNEEMLMFYYPKRLIALNLETRRVRKIDLNLVYLENDSAVIATTTYMSSLVGLNRLAHI